ncbi:hypothetical protein F2Q65_02435 [Thiohalocapsa marina]|uniref:Uncharacterized protein n=1 Tax=Thiohalocapsa marina TaxID=424902 RepID=A0A5M8FUI6_9GAMM|nr:hypothetical protein [Thiohalocapsa marina]KAA6187399.1 hypothetical protein F2Q65_02435 [Thiohalocapsa marina]
MMTKSSDLPPTGAGRQFLLQLASCALLATINIVVLLPIVASHSEERAVIPAEAFRLVEGHATRLGDEWQIQAPSGRGRVVLLAVFRSTTNADRLRQLEIELGGASATPDVMLYWAPAGSRTLTGKQALQDPAAPVELAQLSDWPARIGAIGLGFSGSALKGTTFGGVTLSAGEATFVNFYRRLFADWTWHQGWIQSSINLTAGYRPNAPISPNAVLAAWVGLSLLFLLAWRLYHRIPLARALPRAGWFTVLGVAWLLADAHWQFELWQRLLDTQRLYAGTPSADRVVDLGAQSLQIRALQQARAGLPPEATIHLVSPSEALRLYLRYRLPNPVLLYHELHPESFEWIKPGDGLLLLGATRSQLQPVPTADASSARFQLTLDGEPTAITLESVGDGVGPLFLVME